MRNKEVDELWEKCHRRNIELAERNARNVLIVWLVALFLTVLLKLL